jgi:protocatechuate 3,4-dioxygenase beta subunit
MEAAEEAPAPGRYTITGTITDEKTGQPVENVAVIASRVPSEAEEAEFRAKDREAIEEKRTEDIAALIEEKQRLWADASTNTGPDGHFEVPIEHEGDYKITAIPRSHLRSVVEKEFVGEGRPLWNVDITLKNGATISGRITDSFDNKGVPGITVYATLEPNKQMNEAKTDEEGNYLVGGLTPGNYSVVAEIEGTAYRVTKILPFKRTSIANPEQEVRNIDFKLDKGGIVWGYVKTPDDKPVTADVVLCTSESVVTQALSAMVKKAPPLHDNASKEDGYYELSGVPLDEEWRIYATAEDTAPQLADAFILTAREKEVRVDITMFTGSNVYGQVVDGKGKPVPDAKIACFPSYTQLMSPMDKPQVARESHSDDGGYFEIKELPAGNYQVMAHKEGYKYALNGTPLYSNGYHEVKNFRVVLESIEGGQYHVFGTVTDATGSAVEGAKVTLSGIGTESLNGVERETESGPGGDFNFDGVEIGSYVLHTDKEGYARKTLSKVLLDKQNDVVLEAASIVRGRVLVKSTNAAPENGYTVNASLIQSEVSTSDNNGFLSFLEGAESGNKSETFNDTTGTYEMTLSAGTWQLEGSASPLAPARKSITLQPGEVLENIDLILDADGGTIEGVVVTTDGQSPQGATVFLLEASTPSQALTMFAQDGGGENSMQVGDDGSFTFERLGEGTYYAVARHPSYPQAMSPSIPLEAQGTQSGVEIIMGPGGSLEGFVFEQGRGVEGRVVTVVADGQPYTGTSTANGAYLVRNIPAGTWQAFATNPGAGLSLDALSGQGYPVTIFSGSSTFHNFGEFNGITVNVTVASGTNGATLPASFDNFGGRVVLNPATVIPAVGSGLDAGMIPGDHYTVIGGTISIPNVTAGAWRVDYYGLAQDGTYRWRGTQDLEVTGEEPEIDVVIFID